MSEPRSIRSIPPVAGFADLTAASFQKEVLDQDGIVMVEFYRDTCSACHMYGPALTEAAERLEGQMTFGRINGDHHGAYTRQFGFPGDPTVAFFYKGKIVASFAGAGPFSEFRRNMHNVMAEFAKLGIIIRL